MRFDDAKTGRLLLIAAVLTAILINPRKKLGGKKGGWPV
jgi:hypothetical protein